MVTAPTLVVLAAGRARRFGGTKPLAPIGPNGEAIIDYLVSDAVQAGFERVVLVINPSTGPEIRGHVEDHWSEAFVKVEFAIQDEPHGTVHAVLAAKDVVDGNGAFAVSNADDLYGFSALSLLRQHLAAEAPCNAMVAYHLPRTVVGDGSVTRGVCQLDEAGHLIRIDERRQVRAHIDGTITADDGDEPVELAPTSLVSMNLWGFCPEMWPVFEAAMTKPRPTGGEVLLPEVVDDLLHGKVPGAPSATSRFKVFTSDERCVGVTHPGDLKLVQNYMIDQVTAGRRQETLAGSIYRS